MGSVGSGANRSAIAKGSIGNPRSGKERRPYGRASTKQLSVPSDILASGASCAPSGKDSYKISSGSFLELEDQRFLTCRWKSSGRQNRCPVLTLSRRELIPDLLLRPGMSVRTDE